MAIRAVFLARLLAGEMPNSIEEAFSAARVSLFPTRPGDLGAQCSCPDDSSPCKHSAATLYLLAERFDADPFQILAWRGRPRERLIANLRALRPAPDVESMPGRKTAEDGMLEVGRAFASGGTGDIEAFWSGQPGWREVRLEQHPTGAPEALLRELDPELVAELGPAAMATLRSVYLAAAGAARAYLDPADDPGRRPHGKSTRPRRRVP
jgi:uncharacterized Zn finger protein